MSNHETSPTQIPETQRDIEKLSEIGNERREQLREQLENAEAKHKANQEPLERIHNEASEYAEHAKKIETTEVSPAKKRLPLFTNRGRELSFNRTMEGVRQELTAPERSFSKLIHAKPIEKTSDILSSTVARPNSLLAGSISAFVIVTLLYLVAKYYGYQLSGFETIGAFVLGWIIGLIYDYVRLLFVNKP